VDVFVMSRNRGPDGVPLRTPHASQQSPVERISSLEVGPDLSSRHRGSTPSRSVDTS
jgi:hypothetical protein